ERADAQAWLGITNDAEEFSDIDEQSGALKEWLTDWQVRVSSWQHPVFLGQRNRQPTRALASTAASTGFCSTTSNRPGS
ncbi:hypothetical protein ABTE36_23420, partial [Acinetobacter baumannii]